MRISANKLSHFVLEKRRRVLDEICTNAVQLFSTECHIVKQLLTSATALPVFDEKKGVRIIVDIEKDLIEKEAACDKAILLAKNNEKNVAETFIVLNKSEIRANEIRASFAKSIRRFEETPSSDKKMAEMQTELARLKTSFEQKNDPELEAFKNTVNEASSSKVFEYLKSKVQAGKKLSKLDHLLARWIGFEDIRSAYSRAKKYNKELQDFKARRKARISDIEALMKMRSNAFREDARTKIADDLNKALSGVERFERADEDRRKSIVRLHTVSDIFKPVMFLNAAELVLSHDPDMRDVVKALEEQLANISRMTREQAAFLRISYQSLSELLPYLIENLGDEIEFEFENPEEFKNWLSGADWTANNVCDKLKDRKIERLEEEATPLAA